MLTSLLKFLNMTKILTDEDELEVVDVTPGPFSDPELPPP
jgi:hypothetical protein